jgi:hypothetical protein
VPLAVAVAVVVALLGFLLWAIAHEKGPSAPDVAIGYERAWDELDFGLLWDLCGPELREGLRRDQFIEAKRVAYANEPHGRLAEHIDVDTFVDGNQSALVVTRVMAEGTSVRNDVLLERRANGWTVVGYSLRPAGEADAAPTRHDDRSA